MPSTSIPIVGPSSDIKNSQITGQVCRNFYIKTSNEASERVHLKQFPGRLSIAISGDNNRGVGFYGGEVYIVNGSTLYKLDSAENIIEIGFISGSKQCNLDSDGDTLVIATGESKPYAYDGTNLTQGVDIDLPDANTVTYINSRVIYDGTGSDVVFADLKSPLTVNSANVLSDDIRPDDTKAVIVFSQQVFVYSERSIVAYYNDPSAGNPPYRPVQNSTQGDLGLGAVASLVCDKNGIYWQGQDRNIYALSGVQPLMISTPEMALEMSSYSDIDDARGSVFSIDNDYFYLLVFPLSGAWLFNQGSRTWTNLTDGPQGEPSHLNRVFNAYDELYGTDSRNGNIYRLSGDLHSNNGDPIYREKSTPRITARALGALGRDIYPTRLTLHASVGIGKISGAAALPKIMMDFRDHGKGPWLAERWLELGALGDGDVSLTWDDLGYFEPHSGREFRFRVTDAVSVEFWALDIDFEVGI